MSPEIDERLNRILNGRHHVRGDLTVDSDGLAEDLRRVEFDLRSRIAGLQIRKDLLCQDVQRREGGLASDQGDHEEDAEGRRERGTNALACLHDRHGRHEVCVGCDARRGAGEQRGDAGHGRVEDGRAVDHQRAQTGEVGHLAAEEGGGECDVGQPRTRQGLQPEDAP